MKAFFLIDPDRKSLQDLQDPVFFSILIVFRIVLGSTVGRILAGSYQGGKVGRSYIGSYQKEMFVGSYMGSYHDPVESA